MNVFKLLLVLLITALFFSCSRDEEASGPKYATASDNLKIVDDKFAVLAYPDIDLGLGFSGNSVSFSNATDKTPLDTVFYYAELSEVVSWQITIKGKYL